MGWKTGCLGLNGGRTPAMWLLLVPWSFTGGFALRIYRYYPTNIRKPEVEIRTSRGQIIATTLLDKYAEHKILTTFNPGNSRRIAVMASIPDETAKKMLKYLSILGSLKPKVMRRKIFEKLTDLKILTLENLEHVLSIQKLIDD